MTLCGKMMKQTCMTKPGVSILIYEGVDNLYLKQFLCAMYVHLPE